MKIKENENNFNLNNLEIHLCKNVAAQLLAMMTFLSNDEFISLFISDRNARMLKLLLVLP